MSDEQEHIKAIKAADRAARALHKQHQLDGTPFHITSLSSRDTFLVLKAKNPTAAQIEAMRKAARECGLL